jgi:hypothetical protein
VTIHLGFGYSRRNNQAPDFKPLCFRRESGIPSLKMSSFISWPVQINYLRQYRSTDESGFIVVPTHPGRRSNWKTFLTRRPVFLIQPEHRDPQGIIQFGKDLKLLN